MHDLRTFSYSDPRAEGSANDRAGDACSRGFVRESLPAVGSQLSQHSSWAVVIDQQTEESLYEQQRLRWLDELQESSAATKKSTASARLCR